MQAIANSHNDIKPTDSVQSTALLPKNLDEAMRLADVLAKSDIVPKDYQGKPGNVLIAIQWGMEIGLAPLQALQNIASINGRPALWGDAMLALVRGSGLLVSIKEEITDTAATCTVQRRGQSPASRTFTLDDAKKAGLLGKQGPWQQYPKRMLQMRARAWALRDEFTDVMKGLASAEEEQDKPVRDMGTVQSERAAEQSRSVRERVVTTSPTAAKVTLAEILESIAQAPDESALNALGPQAAALQADEQSAARKAFKARRTALREVDQPVDTETGEITDPTHHPEPETEPAATVAEHAEWLAMIDRCDDIEGLGRLINSMPAKIKAELKAELRARQSIIKGEV